MDQNFEAYRPLGECEGSILDLIDQTIAGALPVNFVHLIVAGARRGKRGVTRELRTARTRVSRCIRRLIARGDVVRMMTLLRITERGRQCIALNEHGRRFDLNGLSEIARQSWFLGLQDDLPDTVRRTIAALPPV